MVIALVLKLSWKVTYVLSNPIFYRICSIVVLHIKRILAYLLNPVKPLQVIACKD